MSSRIEQLAEEQYKEQFPYMKKYLECQSRAFGTGTFTFLAGAAMVYLAQELLRTKLPYGRNYFLLLPIVVGTGSAYAITRRNTRICQEMWLAMEEKHSVITPMYERQLQRKEKSSTDEAGAPAKPSS